MNEVMQAALKPFAPKAPVSGWRPIDTAPKPSDWMRQKPYARFVVARFYKITDEGSTEIDEWHQSWVQAASLSFDGWYLDLAGVPGMHGSASFKLRDDATHWMPLDGEP